MYFNAKPVDFRKIIKLTTGGCKNVLTQIK